MLNMNFAQTVFIETDKVDWVASPMSGVHRKPLAREEAERGHATSLVRYDAGSVFRPHPHPLGEEILVLKGVFLMKKAILKPVVTFVIHQVVAMLHTVLMVVFCW